MYYLFLIFLIFFKIYLKYDKLKIKIYYGNRNNQDLLIHNGFVLEKNKNNSFKLKLGVSLNDKLFHQRTEALGKFGLNRQLKFLNIKA
jgi:hypothetical protein